MALRDQPGEGSVAVDYIVVGAGSAGCAVAAGLAAQPDTSVLLLEAGPRSRDPRVHLPAAASELWFGSLDWAYTTEPQPGLAGRRDHWPRGRLLGGSSAINATMYVRGMDVDYDEWAAAGATGWDAAAMTAAFLELEDDVRGPAPHRGVGGPVRVEHQRDPRPVTLAFLDACEELGLPRVDDYHREPDGCALNMVTQRDGRRWSAVDAFLRDHRPGPGSQLYVRTGVQVDRVAVDAGRAIGVDVTVDGATRFARARREVILSAGTVASPTLLQRSGIGPADDLRALGVDVVVDLPGVGANLQDHVVTGMVAAVRGGSLHGADRDPRSLLAWLRNRRGPLTSSTMEAIGFLRTRDAEPAPDIEVVALPMGIRDHGRVRHPRHALTVGAVLLRPRSRGQVRLASSDPSVAPLVDPRVFTDEGDDDLTRMVDGLAFVQRLLTETSALEPVVEELLEPDRPLTDRAALADHARALAQTLYHPVGTCRIGTDAAAVVDPELRVVGIDGLRVADASVMPTLIRGHTNAPSMAIGMRAARLIAPAGSVPSRGPGANGQVVG